MIGIHQEEKTVSASDSGWSAGVWKGLTGNRITGILNQVYVESATSTTTFKFKIYDERDRIVFDSADWSTNILNQYNLNIPIKGFYEMWIYGPVSLQEQMKILLSIQES